LDGVHKKALFVQFTETSSSGADGGREHGLEFTPLKRVTGELGEVHVNRRCSGKGGDLDEDLEWSAGSEFLEEAGTFSSSSRKLVRASRKHFINCLISSSSM